MLITASCIANLITNLTKEMMTITSFFLPFVGEYLRHFELDSIHILTLILIFLEGGARRGGRAQVQRLRLILHVRRQLW